MKRLFFIPIFCLACSSGSNANHRASDPHLPGGQGNTSQNAAGRDTCAIPRGLVASGPEIGAPQIFDQAGEARVDRLRAELAANDQGEMDVSIEIQISNPGDEAASSIIGYAQRTPMDRLEISFRDLRIEGLATPLTEQTCVRSSSPSLQQPFRTWAHYTEVSLAPRGSAAIRVTYRTALDRADKPPTLFGYHDRFTRNWKNWDWPYTKTAEYREIVEVLKPVHSVFRLVNARQTDVEIRLDHSACRLSGLSHEQNVHTDQGTRAAAWAFSEGDRPEQIELEYTCGLELQDEIRVFSRIAGRRPHDLRSQIRLVQLYYFSGARRERVGMLTSLLGVWEEHSKAQLLKKRNDVRGAAYVALVNTLKQLGQDKRAGDEAKKGIALLDALQADNGKEVADLNGPARKWLASQVE